LIALTDSGVTVDDLPSRVIGNFELDFQEPAGASDQDGRLSLSEMSAFGFSEFIATTTDLKADVDLHFDVSFEGSNVFPRMRADLVVDWQLGTDPTVGFENVQLNLGDFFGGFAGNILGEIQRTLAPVQPVIEVLTTPLPVLSDLSGHAVTLVDVARQFGRADVANFAQAVIDVNNLIVGLPQIGSDVWVDLGEFSVPGSVALDPNNGGNFQLDVQTPSMMPLAQFGSPSKGGSNSGKWVNNLQGAKGSFSFPFLTEPSQAFQLLLGGEADLFRYDAPPLGIDFSYSQFFPVPPIPILGAEIAGRIFAVADFEFGMDTSGFHKFDVSGDVLDILDGFFIADVDQNGVDVSEVRLGGSLTAGAKLELLIASAGVRGGVFANVDFNLHDIPDPETGLTDGKIRGRETRGWWRLSTSICCSSNSTKNSKLPGSSCLTSKWIAPRCHPIPMPLCHQFWLRRQAER
jgi:hypothetical protein